MALESAGWAVVPCGGGGSWLGGGSNNWKVSKDWCSSSQNMWEGVGVSVGTYMDSFGVG